MIQYGGELCGEDERGAMEIQCLVVQALDAGWEFDQVGKKWYAPGEWFNVVKLFPLPATTNHKRAHNGCMFE
ncbi:MAG: hypothetical protein WC244_02995 [Patescibacteria group bacterium]|jgi:hypothetical protein